MPGGNKNIKPEDGRQFSTEYQPQEKWTEERALKVANDLIDWLKTEDENMFFEEFLYLNNDYYPNLIKYLSNKFTSFCELIRKAKKIQEVKLMKFGCFDKLNASMTKFTLINNHNWKDKNETNLLSNGMPLNIINLGEGENPETDSELGEDYKGCTDNE